MKLRTLGLGGLATLSSLVVLALAPAALADDAPQSNGALAPEANGPAPKERLIAQVSGGGGGGAESIKDESSEEKTKKEENSEEKNPWGGSMFLFDQSATTNSFSKGAQLSYSPSYEWWISPRLYYTVKDHFKFGARFDFFKEFTNHEETSAAREWRPGDPWLTASYGHQASFLNKHEKSRYSIGLIFKPPLSKDSRGNGQYFSAGPSAALSWGFDIMGAKKKFLQSASLGLYASYSHAFTKCTTPCPFNGYERYATDSNGGVILDSQVRSGTIAGNSLIYSINGSLDILENLGFGASMIWIDQFSYRPPPTTLADGTGSGSAEVPRNPNDTRFRQLTWFLVSLDYDPIKELGMSLGYYNLANTIALDGSRRNPFWSPDARVFFSLTAHLDAIYEDAAMKKKTPAAQAIGNFRAFQ